VQKRSSAFQRQTGLSQKKKIAMEKGLQRKLKACSDLPSLPAVAARVIEVAEDPAASMADISNAVSLDPALATKLLRIANSPLYARSRQISNLNMAVMVLGLNATIMLALSFSLSASIKKSRNGGIDYALFWRRALLAAAAARVIATKLDKVPAEDAFLATMLRDIGLVALDKVQPHGAARAADPIEIDHIEVGIWLLDQWRFPAHLVNAIKDSQHCNDLNRSEAENNLARCVALAGTIADAFLADSMHENLSSASCFIQQHWNADSAWVDKVLEAVASEVPEIEELFDMDLMDTGSLTSLLTQARELMMIRSLHTAHALDSSREESEKIAQKAQLLEEKSNRDHLTGLWNRAYQDKAIKIQFVHSDNDQQPVSVIFMDLDHFKQINDTYGHQAGDEALKHAAQILLDHTRSYDVVSRYGGEEFVIILPGINCDTATRVANRLVSSLRTSLLATDTASNIVITASAGVATHNDKYRFDNAESLMRAADQAMYLAKTNGRDRFVVHSKCV
jgi:diguanylate cyclase (GGDEF)-like protein